MKPKLPYVIVAVIVLTAAGGGWYYWKATSPSGGISGFPRICPHCGHFFTLSEDELYTHPRGAKGEGLQCAKCGKYGAQTAARCEKCGEWMIPQEGPGGASTCPKCKA